MQKLILYKIPIKINDELKHLYNQNEWTAIVQLLNQYRVSSNHPMCSSCLSSYQVIKRDLPKLWQDQNSL